MERKVGTVSRGVRCPIIREGDDLAKIVVDSVIEAAKSENYEIRDRDIVAMTESIVARAQGNYASVDAIAKDVKEKLSAPSWAVRLWVLSSPSCPVTASPSACGVLPGAPRRSC